MHLRTLPTMVNDVGNFTVDDKHRHIIEHLCILRDRKPHISKCQSMWKISETNFLPGRHNQTKPRYPEGRVVDHSAVTALPVE